MYRCHPKTADLPAPRVAADVSVPAARANGPGPPVPPVPLLQARIPAVSPVVADIAVPPAEPQAADAAAATRGETAQAGDPVPPDIWPPAEPSDASAAGATPDETGVTEQNLTSIEEPPEDALAAALERYILAARAPRAAAPASELCDEDIAAGKAAAARAAPCRAALVACGIRRSCRRHDGLQRDL